VHHSQRRTGKDVEGNFPGFIKYTIPEFIGGTEEKYENLTIVVTGRGLTRHLPNRNY
jgi:hypothetical protein